MAKEHGDEDGLFWNAPIVVKKAGAVMPRRRPPIPDTGWAPPQGFPDLSSAKQIAIDTETHDPRLRELGPGCYRDGHIVGVSIATDDGFKAYYPIAHADSSNFDKDKVMGWLRQELSRPQQEKVGANLYYDLDFLACEGVHVKGMLRDVQVAEPLLDENKFSYSLETLAQQYCGRGKEEDAMGKWAMAAFGCSKKDVKSYMKDIPATLVGPYAEEDAVLPLEILRAQRVKLEQQGLTQLFDLESRLTPALLRMRQTGTRVDIAKAEQARDALQKRLAEAHAVMGGAYQNDKTYLVRKLQAEGIAIPKTAAGNASLTKDWLEAQDNWLCRAVVEARKYEKVIGTFLDGYIFQHSVNGRIHAQFNQLKSDEYGTVSGRFSSSNPNLQNIPSRDPELGPLLRGLFIPEEGCKWWAGDWSQVEYRLIVHFAYARGLAGAEEAWRMYKEDASTDFHKAVAQICGIPRSDAKHINFGIAYGQGIALLAIKLGVSIDEAQEVMKKVKGNAPFIPDLSRLLQEEVTREGYLCTLYGRRRRFDMFESRWERDSGMLPYDKALAKWGKRSNIQRAGVHKALNAAIQGSAADIMKEAMVQIWDAGIFDVLPVHLTVHDELDGSLPDTPQAQEALKELYHIMESCVPLHVPLLVDRKTCNHWGEAK